MKVQGETVLSENYPLLFKKGTQISYLTPCFSKQLL